MADGRSISTDTAFCGNSKSPTAGLPIAGGFLATEAGSGEIPAHSGSTRHAGNIADNTGTTNNATIASSHTRCRVAAESRLRIMAATAANISSAVPSTAESTSSRLDALNSLTTVSTVRFISTALLLCLFDQRNQPLTLV